MFVSSHLISEMSLTADRLVVIGRGRLIAETSVADFVARSGRGAVRLVTPDLAAFTSALTRSRRPGRRRRRRVADRRGADRPADRRPGRPRRPPGPRADADRGVAGGRVHGTDPGRGGVPPLDDDRRRRRPEGVIEMSLAIQTAPFGHYRVKHVVRSEVVKILTLPSTAITLGLTVVAGLLVTGLVTNSALHHSPDWYNGFDPTQSCADRPDRGRPDRRRVRSPAHHRRVLERHHPHHPGRHSQTALCCWPPRSAWRPWSWWSSARC